MLELTRAIHLVRFTEAIWGAVAYRSLRDTFARKISAVKLVYSAAIKFRVYSIRTIIHFRAITFIETIEAIINPVAFPQNMDAAVVYRTINLPNTTSVTKIQFFTFISNKFVIIT